ncbi:MAG: hypothetical protein V1835_02415 [Candidatus Micrarchaeota archaeon]
MKNTGLVLYVMLIALFAAVFMMGCTSENQGDRDNPDFQGRQFGRGGNFPRDGNFSGNRTFGNMTEEQRQQMMQQRQQEIINACKGRAEGDICTITNPRGNTEGTCKTLNNQLLCETPFPSGRPPSP